MCARMVFKVNYQQVFWREPWCWNTAVALVSGYFPSQDPHPRYSPLTSVLQVDVVNVTWAVL